MQDLRNKMHRHFKRSGATKEDILTYCQDWDVQFIDMQFSDIFGVLKAITIPVHKLEDALDHNVWFDGSSIQGFTGVTEADMYLVPDKNTFSVLPWTLETPSTTARLICDVYLPNGEAFQGCPRRILRKMMEKAESMGYAMNAGPELEFFFFETDEEGQPLLKTHDEGNYFDQTGDKALEFRRVLALALDSMGLEVEALHHEVAPGQHEINFRFGDALQTADNVQSFKQVVRTLAQEMGLHACFMPKPIFGVNGSGMHVHQSLKNIETGENVFYKEGGTYNLSEVAEAYVAGQMKHIKAMNAILNPLVNSYKRMVVGYEAPVNVAWGQQNRSALIRVPRLSPTQAKRGARIELRCPDPSTNPYLAFAVMLGAGLDGIANNMKAPAPIELNIWKLSKSEMAELGVTSVASDLGEALDHLESNSLMKSILGEHTLHYYLGKKRKEYDKFRLYVTDWEWNMYRHA